MIYNATKLKLITQQYYQSAVQIESFLNVLKPYNISDFSYGRIYSDHSTIHLTSEVEFSVYYVKHELFNQAYYSKSEQYHDYNYVWNIDDAPSLFLPWQNITGNKSGITLVRKYENYCEMSYFSSHLDHYEIINFFINNIKRLEFFTQYFCQHYASLISENEKNKVKFVKNGNQDILVKKVGQNKFSYQENLSLLLYKPSNTQKLIINLSRKEQTCLKYMVNGYTLKETAKLMNISPRTAEKHVINTKNKLGFKTTKQLIATWNKIGLSDLSL